MAASSNNRSKPERAFMLLDYLGFPPPDSLVPRVVNAATGDTPGAGDPDFKPGTQDTLDGSTIRAQVFLGPDGRPMIVNGDLRQPVLIRSDRFMDYLYYLYELKMGRLELPSASGLKAVQRTLAGQALKAGSIQDEGISADPLLDVLLTVLDTALQQDAVCKKKLPDLKVLLDGVVSDTGYNKEDIPSNTAELSKQIRDRTEALVIRGISVTFTRSNDARYVEFSKIKHEETPKSSGSPPKVSEQEATSGEEIHEVLTMPEPEPQQDEYDDLVA